MSSEAAEVLQRGGIVLFPTETVYGIGADSRNAEACLRIYKIKNRPTDNPLIVHLADTDSIAGIARMNPGALVLAGEFLPGPLTMILKKSDPKVYSTGLDTIGVRVPSHGAAHRMLSAFGGPVSAPSANVSGRPSITRMGDAIREFQGEVDLILKGEDPKIGLESTVVDLSTEPPRLLRPGAYEFSELSRFLPDLVLAEPLGSGEKPASPGMKYRHYAPDCRIFLATGMETPSSDSAAIGIGIETSGWAYAISVKNNSEYMKELYSFFRDCDAKGIRTAFCFQPLFESGRDALLNRITKAAAAS